MTATEMTLFVLVTVLVLCVIDIAECVCKMRLIKKVAKYEDITNRREQEALLVAIDVMESRAKNDRQ